MVIFRVAPGLSHGILIWAEVRNSVVSSITFKDRSNMSFLFATSQTFNVESLEPLTSNLESAEKDTWYTGATCPLKVATYLPVFPSQSLIDLSNEAETK